jgi:hypothetical protein
MKPVALPPGRARLSTKPAPTGSPASGKTTGIVWVQEGRHGRVAGRQNDIRRERDQLLRVPANLNRIGRGPARFDANVAADGPAQERELLIKRREPRLKHGIFRSPEQQDSNGFHLLALRTRHQRPCGRRTGNNPDEIPSAHQLPPESQVRCDLRLQHSRSQRRSKGHLLRRFVG